MIKFFTITLLSLYLFPVYSQSIELDIRKNKLYSFIDFERSNQGKLVNRNDSHQLPSNVSQPLIFKRDELNLPDLLVYYFFYSQDSSIYYLLYEWDDRNFKSSEEQKIPKSDSEISFFVERYNSLVSQFTQKYGKGKSEGSIGNTSNINSVGISRKDLWITSDSLELDLSINLSGVYEQKGIMTKVPTYRIRLYVRKAKREAPPLSTMDLLKCEKTFKRFLFELREDNYDNAAECFTEKERQKITIEKLQRFQLDIKVGLPVETYLVDVQYNSSGEQVYCLRFKYSKDKKNPPKELIKVLYDRNGRIQCIERLYVMRSSD